MLPIEYAAAQGNREVVRVLVEQSKCIPPRDTGESKEKEAREQIIKEIVKAGQRMRIEFDHSLKFNLLGVACYFGYMNLIYWDLLNNTKLRGLPGIPTISPMHLAVAGNQLEVVKLLQREVAGAGDDWNLLTFNLPPHAWWNPRPHEKVLRGPLSGISPLHLAAYYGHLDIVEFLLSKEMIPESGLRTKDPNVDPQRRMDCRSPLDMAALKGHTRVVHLLLDYYVHKLPSSSDFHLSAAEVGNLATELTELAKRAQKDGASALLLMAMKEKNVRLSKVILDLIGTAGDPNDDWIEEFFYPLKKLSPVTYLSFNYPYEQCRYRTHVAHDPIFRSSLYIGDYCFPDLPTLVEDSGRGLFPLACFTGDLQLIERFTPHGDRPNSKELWPNGDMEPSRQYLAGLTTAALQGYEDIVIQILNNPECNFKHSFGLKQALFFACGGGHLELAKKLLEMKAEIGMSLFAGIFSGNVELVRLLLELEPRKLVGDLKINLAVEWANSGKPDWSKHVYGGATTSIFENPLQFAASCGKLEMVRELLKYIDIDEVGDYSFVVVTNPNNPSGGLGNGSAHNFSPISPLQRALAMGHKEVVHELIRLGALTKTSKIPQEATTLYYACWRGDEEVAEACLKRDKYPPGVYKHMLALASLFGYLGVARALIDKVSMEKDRTEQSYNRNADPFYCAVAGGNVQIVEMMVERGAKLSKVAKDYERRFMTLRGAHQISSIYSPFSEAVMKDRVEMVKWLIDKGVDVNKVNCYGHTALDMALRFMSTSGTFIHCFSILFICAYIQQFQRWSRCLWLKEHWRTNNEFLTS